MARTKKKDYGSGSFRKRGKKYEYRFSYSALDGKTRAKKISLIRKTWTFPELQKVRLFIISRLVRAS